MKHAKHFSNHFTVEVIVNALKAFHEFFKFKRFIEINLHCRTNAPEGFALQQQHHKRLQMFFLSI